MLWATLGTVRRSGELLALMMVVLGEFQRDYPDWRLTHGIDSILRQIHDVNAERWVSAPA
jgi:hypothetical protein